MGEGTRGGDEREHPERYGREERGSQTAWGRRCFLVSLLSLFSSWARAEQRGKGSRKRRSPQVAAMCTESEEREKGKKKCKVSLKGSYKHCVGVRKEKKRQKHGLDL